MTMPDTITAVARRYAVDVNVGTEAAPDWQRLIGMREFTPNVEPVHEDDGVYEDEGWAGSVRTGAAWTLEFTLSHRYDESGQFHPTHRHLRDSSTEFGFAAYVQLRWYDIGGPDRSPAADDAWQGVGLVTWAPEGGEQTNPDRISVTITGHGKRIAIANPVGTAQDPVVLSLDPATGLEAGGELVNIFGSWFIDVQDVEFGASNSADEFTVISASRIVAVAPAGTGSQEVIVTTAAGTSSDGPDYVYT